MKNNIWRLFYKVQFVIEKTKWENHKLYFIKIKYRFFKTKYYLCVYKMTSKEVMEYDRNKKDFENKVFKFYLEENAKNRNISKKR